MANFLDSVLGMKSLPIRGTSNIDAPTITKVEMMIGYLLAITLSRKLAYHANLELASFAFGLNPALINLEDNIGITNIATNNEDNKERKRRALELAKENGTEVQNIAGAWPINLEFPSFALIGPRLVAELVSNLKNLDVELTKDQVAWLNLKN